MLVGRPGWLVGRFGCVIGLLAGMVGWCGGPVGRFGVLVGRLMYQWRVGLGRIALNGENIYYKFMTYNSKFIHNKLMKMLLHKTITHSFLKKENASL